jgi:hypothetical protein
MVPEQIFVTAGAKAAQWRPVRVQQTVTGHRTVAGMHVNQWNEGYDWKIQRYDDSPPRLHHGSRQKFKGMVERSSTVRGSDCRVVSVRLSR